MKYLLILLLISFGYSISFAQSAFKLIHKAERAYESGAYEKAFRLLNKAEKKDDGFCGNEWLEADCSIQLVRAKIYIKQEGYLLVRNILIQLLGKCPENQIDALLLKSYLEEYGRELLQLLIPGRLAIAKIHGFK